MARSLVPGRVLTLSMLAVAFVACVGLALSAQQPPPQPPPQQPPGPAANPLDEPIAWLKEAERNFGAVRNYTGTLIKRERVKGVLQEENIILFAAKTQPFSVHMKWISPAKLVGQEVCYVQGRNGNKMRVHAAKGIPSLAGWVSIDPFDRKVLEHSRHTILEWGLSNMIKENIKNLETARQYNKTDVRKAEYTYDERLCIRLETTNRERWQNCYCHRSVLYLDKRSKVPVRMENYDWPTSANPQGELLEVFSYVNLHFNDANLNENLFNK